MAGKKTEQKIKISVTETEYEAMRYAVNTWETNCDGANDEYIESHLPDIKAMQSLVNKYHAEYRRKKAVLQRQVDRYRAEIKRKKKDNQDAL